MHFIIHSEPGHSHINEDAANVLIHPQDEQLLICALADGQGGQAGGAAASNMAVDTCLRLAKEYSPKKLRSTSAWQEILMAVDEAIARHPDAGFTTIIMLCTDGSRVWGASSGDSAVLLAHGNKHQVLSERQKKNPPIGSTGAFPVAFTSRCEKNMKLLLMSDGVWRFIGMETIASVAIQHEGQSLIESLRNLQTTASNGILSDDFTFICVQGNKRI